MEGVTGAQPWPMALGPRDNEPTAAAGSSTPEHNLLQVTQMAVGNAGTAACRQQAAVPSASALFSSHHQAAAAAASAEMGDASDVRSSGARPMVPGPQDNEHSAAAGIFATERSPLRVAHMAVDNAAADLIACRQQGAPSSSSPLISSRHQATAAISSETIDAADVRIAGACQTVPGALDNGSTAAAGPPATARNPLQIAHMAADDATAAACCQQAAVSPSSALISSSHQIAIAASSAEMGEQAHDAFDGDICDACPAQSCLDCRGPSCEQLTSASDQPMVNPGPEHVVAASQTQGTMVLQARAEKACMSPSVDEGPILDAAPAMREVAMDCQQNPAGEPFEQAGDASLPAMQAAQLGKEGHSSPTAPAASGTLTVTQAAAQPPEQPHLGTAEMQPAHEEPLCQKAALPLQQQQQQQQQPTFNPRVEPDDVINLLDDDTDNDDSGKLDERQPQHAEACPQRKLRKRLPEPDARSLRGQAG